MKLDRLKTHYLFWGGFASAGGAAWGALQGRISTYGVVMVVLAGVSSGCAAVIGFFQKAPADIPTGAVSLGVTATKKEGG